MASFACLGDSITSDQVTGIGTRVAQLLGATPCGNFACGYATCSDWHDGKRNVTRVTLTEPPNTNTDDNVLSNQVRRLLQAITPRGEIIRWHHPLAGDFSLPAEVGLGQGTLFPPDILYIAISTNDGNHPLNAGICDTEAALRQPYEALDRCGIASSLRWAVETLRCACPQAAIFVATPLHAVSDQAWMSEENTGRKRDIILRVCRTLEVQVIDSFQESGFTPEVAAAHGGVHPDEEWKERIARYVAGAIRRRMTWAAEPYAEQSAI